MNNKPNLLIVDDTFENLKFIEALVRGIDLNLIQAQTGFEAIEKINGIDLSLAILDVHMPEMNGYELAKIINGGKSADIVPVIFLTAHFNSEKEIYNNYHLGVVDYLIKPINMNALRGKINVFLELSKQKQQIKDTALELEKSNQNLLEISKAHKESEEKYRMLIEFASDAFFQADSNGRFIRVNREATKLTGYSHNELLNLDVKMLFDELKNHNNPLRFDPMNLGEIMKLERWISKKTGELVLCEINSKQMPDATYQLFVRDITKRKTDELALQESEHKLSALMTNLRGMVYSCLVDENWTVTFVNEGVFELTGYRPNELINNAMVSFYDFIHHDDRNYFQKVVFSALRSSTYFNVEFRIITKTGAVKWVSSRGQGIFGANDNVIAVDGLLVDITEQKRNENIQKALYNISSAVISAININDFIEVVKKQLSTLIRLKKFNVTLYSEATKSMTNPIVPHQNNGDMIWEIPKSLALKIIKSGKALIYNEKQIITYFDQRELKPSYAIPKVWLGVPLIGKNKTIGLVEILSYESEDDYNETDLELIEFVSHQISMCFEKVNNETEIARSHRALINLTMHLEEIREQERKQIALDLHDELGQNLTAINMGIAWLSQNAPPDLPKLLEKMSQLKDLINSTITMVQKISAGLRPTVLDNLGLIPAIKWQVSEFEKNSAIKCYTRIVPEQLELDSKFEILVFRIVQEALTNIARHAHATKARLVLVAKPYELRLVISDNGIGISQEKIEDTTSYGLLGMKERVNSCGGIIRITGKHRKGSRIEIKLPRHN